MDRRPLAVGLAVSMLLLVALASGCGLATVCPRAPSPEVTPECVAYRVDPGDVVWIYTRAGEAYHGALLPFEADDTELLLVTRAVGWTTVAEDTVRLALPDIEKIQKARSDNTSLFVAGVVAGGVAIAVAVLWIAGGLGSALR